MKSSKYDFNIEDASNVFFTSDTHFHHFNIIGSCNRPYKNEFEMNECLINNWNSVVPEDGVVFHLGDFAWGGFPKWRDVRKMLNGNIVLIKGNHDWKNGPQNEYQEEQLFDFVAQQMFMRVEGRQVYLNHYPFLCYAGVYREPKDQVWALHGHIHLGPKSLGGKDVPRMEYLYPTQYDVGVDMNNYTPISWKDVKTKIEYQVENNVNCLKAMSNETKE